jgi:hypothetical protein
MATGIMPAHGLRQALEQLAQLQPQLEADPRIQQALEGQVGAEGRLGGRTGGHLRTGRHAAAASSTGSSSVATTAAARMQSHAPRRLSHPPCFLQLLHACRMVLLAWCRAGSSCCSMPAQPCKLPGACVVTFCGW